MLCASASAGIITWGAPQDTSAPGDVSLTGTLNEAVNMVAGPTMMPGSTTVNGVLFTNDNTVLWRPDTVDMLNGNSTGNAGYDALLNSTDHGDDGAGTVSLQIGSSLSVGALYEVQLWYTDLRGIADFKMGYGDGNGNQVVLDSDIGFGGGFDQFAIGTFVADASTQTLNLSAQNPPGQCHFNA